jgi:hypothetical protein
MFAYFSQPELFRLPDLGAFINLGAGEKGADDNKSVLSWLLVATVEYVGVDNLPSQRDK